MLNDGLLPPGFYAMRERVTAVTAGDFTLLRHPPPDDPEPPTGSGVRTSRREPPVAAWFGRARRVVRPSRLRLVVRHECDHRVVAVVALAIPEDVATVGRARRVAEKAAAVVEAGVHFLFIDPFRPPKHAPAGLHAAIWKKVIRPRKGHRPFSPPADQPLLAASYCASSVRVTAAVQPFAVGEPVPDIPLYLTADEEYVTLPLEATYAAAWPDVPEVWRDVLEA